VKEASGNLVQMMRIRELCGDRLALLSGDDPLTLPILAIGGSGVISVTANVAPAAVKRSVAAWLDGKPKEALALHEALMPLHSDLFLEANPIPAKTALFLMNRIALEFRPPLCEMQPANLARLKATLAAQKLIP
jgi:4-hydroxy-tetrahydrodipicolinate synthase